MTEHRNEAVRVHFYRAVVAHMDVWRQRMDATTNWAAATAAGMITFTFSNADAPHYVLLLALLFQAVFLMMEARRYQTFDLWRRRFRVLNRAFVVPTLKGRAPDEATEAELGLLADDMGRTVPHLSLFHAAGYRTRRNYGYLFALTLLAWLMKLEIQPEPARAVGVLVDRAAIAFFPGAVILSTVLVCFGALILMALAAPTSDIVDWEATASGWASWRSRLPGRRRAAKGAGS